MKKIISSLAIGLACLVHFTSCDQDNVADLYQSENPKAVSFVAGYTEFALEGESKSVMVPICREDNSAEASVSLGELQTDSEYFTLASNSVTFKAGESVTHAVINVDVENMPFGNTFEIGLTINDPNVNSFGNQSSTILISRTLTWTEMPGEGLFISEFFDGSSPVKVMKADQVEIYQAVEPYDVGLNIQFQVKKGNKVIVAPQAAWRHETYGIVMVRGEGVIADGVITVTLEHYVDGVGSFGPAVEKLNLPK